MTNVSSSSLTPHAESSGLVIDDKKSANIRTSSFQNIAKFANSSCRMDNIERCYVNLDTEALHAEPFRDVRITNINSSIVLAGIVNGPISIRNVSNSVVVVAAKQVRVFGCKNINLYVHAASGPVIEESSGVRVAPINEQHSIKQLKEMNNLWDQVQDFQWLRSEPSPNWSVLPEEHRVNGPMWRTVDENDSRDVNEILEMVGLPSGTAS